MNNQKEIHRPAGGNGSVGGPAFLTRRYYLYVLLAIFAAGAALRLYRIADQVILDDEWHALNAVQYHDFRWIFTHFGGSDHSIPLALFYELQYQLVGLSEILMRWPMLLAGCATLLLLPYLLRHWLTRPERLLFAALLAISPVLIYYSRFARPYSLLVLLEPVALLMAWHWWNSRQIKYGVAWVLLATLSAWLNTPALIVVTAPFTWFGLVAVRAVILSRDWTGLFRLTATGLCMLAILAALLGPPLATQPEAIFVKAGQHFIDRETLPWALSLASGSGRVWVYISMGLLSLTGLMGLFQRDREFARYLFFTGLMAVIILIVTGAAFAVHGNVFLRYLIGFLPVYLACIAVGMVQLTHRIVRRSPLPPATRSAAFAIVISGLVLAGPLPDWPLGNNQFITHQNYHFHYDQERNLYTQAMKSWYQAEPFYAEIAALHGTNETLIVEAPWYMESYSNPLNLQQQVHRQRVQIGFINGLCAGPLFGELTMGQPGMRFRNFVYLQELVDGSRSADYLVLRHRGMPELPRAIEMEFEKCEQAVRAKFGSPWRESKFALVFRITPLQ